MHILNINKCVGLTPQKTFDVFINFPCSQCASTETFLRPFNKPFSLNRNTVVVPLSCNVCGFDYFMEVMVNRK